MKNCCARIQGFFKLKLKLRTIGQRYLNCLHKFNPSESKDKIWIKPQNSTILLVLVGYPKGSTCNQVKWLKRVIGYTNYIPCCFALPEWYKTELKIEIIPNRIPRDSFSLPDSIQIPVRVRCTMYFFNFNRTYLNMNFVTKTNLTNRQICLEITKE